MPSKRSFLIHCQNLCNRTGAQHYLDKQLKKINHPFRLLLCTSIKNNPVIIKLLNMLNSMGHTKKVIFCWIPSHIEVQGNCKADTVAKSSIDMVPDKNPKIWYTDLKSKISQTLTKKWQELWNENTFNKQC